MQHRDVPGRLEDDHLDLLDAEGVGLAQLGPEVVHRDIRFAQVVGQNLTVLDQKQRLVVDQVLDPVDAPELRDDHL